MEGNGLMPFRTHLEVCVIQQSDGLFIQPVLGRGCFLCCAVGRRLGNSHVIDVFPSYLQKVYLGFVFSINGSCTADRSMPAGARP